MSRETPRMKLDLTRGEVERLHEEIGDLPKSRVGPKLLEFYRRLDNVLRHETRGPSSNSNGGVVVPMRGGGKQ